MDKLTSDLNEGTFPFTIPITLTTCHLFPNGSSKESININNQYKLHVCQSSQSATAIIEKLTLLTHTDLTPALLQSHGPYLLIEYLHGDTIPHWTTDFYIENDRTLSSNDLCDTVGRMLGQVNTIYMDGEYDLFAEFLERVNRWEGLQAGRREVILDRFNVLFQETNCFFGLCVDFRDTALKNFMVRKKDAKILYVDEGGIGKFKGMGLSRLLRRSSIDSMDRMNEDHLVSLMSGYREALGESVPLSYFKMLSMFELVAWLSVKYDETRDNMLKNCLENNYPWNCELIV